VKIQCSCGSKYVIEVTPDMARQPVHFVCGTCGRDASEFVTNLVRQELGLPAVAPAFSPPPPGAAMIAPPPPGATMVRPPTVTAGMPRPVAMVMSAPVATPGTVIPPMPPGPIAAPPAPAIGIGAPRPVAHVAGPRPTAPPTEEAPQVAAPRPGGLRVHKDAAPAPVAEAPSAPAARVKCSKHGVETTDKCYVCSKPICPQCLQLFGYVCSPLCRAKAESHGINVPVYAGQKNVIEAKLWRKVVLITTSTLGGTALILGVWFWYAWFGQTPKPILAIRFENDPAYSGVSAFAGKDQIVYLHGGTLARYDMKQKKSVWSHYIIDKKQIQADVEKEMREIQKEIDDANNRGSEHVPKMPDKDKLARQMEKYEARSMELRVLGSNIWIMKPGKLIRYDWEKGELEKEIAVKERYDRRLNRGDQLLFLTEERDRKNESVMRINLNTCETSTEDLMGTKTDLAMNTPKPADAGRIGTKDSGTTGLPTAPGQDKGKPIDPKKVQQQVQHMSLPSKIALPATLGSTLNQDRALNELDDEDNPGRRGAFGRKKNEEVFTLVPTKDGFIQFNVKLLEEKIVTRVAMKAQPPVKTGGKASLENVSVANQYDVINDMINQSQRERGGDKIEEDESTYQVKIKKPDGSDEWVGKVIGQPSVFPLQTVTVVTGAKMLIVLDKNNKQMWQGTNTYPVASSWRDPDDEDPRYGQGPCVERKDTLYVFDEGVLTSFDLATGNVHWRLPSVGISGLHFDDKGMIYVNTTDAGPESIKYSRQIDITTRISDVVLKVDPKTGKTLWKASPGGAVSYVSGQFLYTVQSYDPHDDDEDASPYTVTTGFETQPYVRIRRINPKNGKEMWEHFQQRAPLDVQFDQNRIRMVFRKEVQVLQFLAL
jgi:outer membrane protein assembly factor BamB